MIQKLWLRITAPVLLFFVSLTADLKEIWLRAGMESPRIFKKLSARLITIGTICASALAGGGAAENFLNVSLYPAWAANLLSLGAFGGFLGYLIARLPVTDPEALNEKLGKE